MPARDGLLAKVVAVVAAGAVAGGIAFAMTGDDPVPRLARAWIDDPIDGAVVPSGSLFIAVHAFDPDGVSEIALMIDGIEVAAEASDGGRLERAVWTWTLDDLGTHLLEVVGRDPGGEAGIAGSAVVRITGPTAVPDPGIPPTTVSSTSTTSTTTSTSTTATTTTSTTTTIATTTTTTLAPCTPPSPILFEPEDGVTLPGPDPEVTLEWVPVITFPIGCLASGFRVEIAIDQDFTDLRAAEDFDSSTTEWTPPPGTWWCNTTHYWRVWSVRSDGTLALEPSARELSVVCVE